MRRWKFLSGNGFEIGNRAKIGKNFPVEKLFLGKKMIFLPADWFSVPLTLLILTVIFDNGKNGVERWHKTDYCLKLSLEKGLK